MALSRFLGNLANLKV